MAKNGQNGEYCQKWLRKWKNGKNGKSAKIVKNG